MNINNTIWSQKMVVSPYCRVSTDKDDQANSLESQIKYFSSFIANHPNWTLGEVYYDEGISGTSVKKRKNFNRLIDDAMTGKVQFIITKEVSRFARNTVDTLVFTRQLKDKGIGVYFALDNINTLDSDGELRLTIMASLAQEESRKTSERVKWGQRRRMEQGVVFGQDLFGYEVKDGKISVKPDEAELLKELFNKYLDGMGTMALGKFMRSSPLNATLQRSWDPAAIFNVLRNEKYVGDLCQRKHITPNYLTRQKIRNTDSDDKIYIRDHHEAIIDRNTWEKVQAELVRRSPTSNNKVRHSTKHWCSSKIFCGHCDRRYTKFDRKFPSGKVTITWRCYENARNGHTKIIHDKQVGCDNRSLNERVLIECIKEAIKFIGVNHEKLIAEILQEISQLKLTLKSIDISSLLEKIEELNADKKKAINLCIKGLISEEELQEQKNLIDDEIALLEKHIADSTQEKECLANQDFNNNDFNLAIKKILSLEFDDDNLLLLREILAKVYTYKDRTLTIFLHHFPFGIKFRHAVSGPNQNYSIITENLGLVDLNQSTN